MKLPKNKRRSGSDSWTAAVISKMKKKKEIGCDLNNSGENLVERYYWYLTDILLSDASNLLMLVSCLSFYQAIINKPMLFSWCRGQRLE